MHNLLTGHAPSTCVAHYHGPILSTQDADHYYQTLLHVIPWQHDELLMFGKRITTKRKVAWYGNEPYQYTYAHSTKTGLPWTPELKELKAIVEHASGETYNCCLLNLYHDGAEGMGWHADDEPELRPNAAIASLSLGAARKFMFRHRKTKETVSVMLEHGSLLVMKGEIQRHWQHQLPPTKKVHEPRINLTFRTIDKI